MSVRAFLFSLSTLLFPEKAVFQTVMLYELFFLSVMLNNAAVT